MIELKYKVIKSKEQYYTYCNILEHLIIQQNEDLVDEIELIDLLIQKWDQDHNTFDDLDPVELLKALMEDHELRARDLVEILNLSKGTVSKILNYRKGLSKESIRKLSQHFKLTHEAFNRPYPLVHQVPDNMRSAS